MHLLIYFFFKEDLVVHTVRLGDETVFVNFVITLKVWFGGL